VSVVKDAVSNSANVSAAVLVVSEEV